MKKYVKPASQVLSLQAEQIIASSLYDVNNDNGTDDEALSRQKSPWSSESWTESDDEAF